MNKKWTKEEENILKKVFNRKGLTLRTYRRVRLVKEGLDEILSQKSKFRTPDAIRGKARRMGLICKDRRVNKRKSCFGTLVEEGLSSVD